ncbi:MAG: porin family protein [Gammaproteobacteria bacterium]|nr:porin family protein [Gammaproteobacteria bacterium]
MKKKIATALLVGWMGLCTTANAEDKKWYAGIDAGLVTTRTAAISSKDPVSLGLTFGYRIADTLNLALEATYTATISDGKDYAPQRISSKNTWDAEAIGLYMAYRTNGNIYAKIKGGLAHTTYNVTENMLKEEKEKTQPSGGIGFGIKGQKVSLEFEYTRIHSDINLFSLGMRF